MCDWVRLREIFEKIEYLSCDRVRSCLLLKKAYPCVEIPAEGKLELLLFEFRRLR
jgi:hypothetical protein